MRDHRARAPFLLFFCPSLCLHLYNNSNNYNNIILMRVRRIKSSVSLLHIYLTFISRFPLQSSIHIDASFSEFHLVIQLPSFIFNITSFFIPLSHFFFWICSNNNFLPQPYLLFSCCLSLFSHCWSCYVSLHSFPFALPLFAT